MFQAPAPAENPTEFQRITQIPRNLPTQFGKIRTIYSHYTLRFRCLTSGRERRKIPANQVKFARFAPVHRELRKFRALRTKINTYVIDFQISDHRQRNQENWSESTRFRSIRHLLRELREFRAFRSKLIHV